MTAIEQEGLIAIQCDRGMESWKKILNILQQQTILQKNKLTEILKTNTENTKQITENAEQYQSRFLQQDEAIRLMANDFAEYRKLEEQSGSFDKEQLRKLNQARKKLEKETENLEMNFSKLQREFNNFFLHPNSTR